MPRLVQFNRVKPGGLRFYPGVFLQYRLQFNGIFLFLCLQLLQAGF